LTLVDTTSLVVGTIIGTGVFLKAAPMAQDLGSPTMVLLAWVAAGALSLAGALTYAELGTLFPEAGGDYVFLREAYGELPAFLFGWMSLAVASTGVIAALGVAFATFTSVLVPLGLPWAACDCQLFGWVFHWELGPRELLAVGAILVFSAVNCAGLVLGARVQVVLTVVKVVGVAVIVVAALTIPPETGWGHLRSDGPALEGPGLRAFGLGMLSALWAYNGFYCVPMFAGEIQKPERNLSRGLILGMGTVITVYLLANAAYFYLLPLSEVVTANSTAYPTAMPVAVKAAATPWGDTGTRLVSIAFVVSTLGALNGIVMVTARIPFAMARDGLLPAGLARVSPASRVPVTAIVLQAVWASALALSGTFDQLTTYVIFASWVFYGVTASSVFVFRRRLPSRPRPYRVPGYPLVPLLFVLVAAWLVINTLISFPLQAGLGLTLITLGVPVFFWNRRARATARHDQPQPTDS
jgi:APA family basic amino acid/polyamine antiporter